MVPVVCEILSFIVLFSLTQQRYFFHQGHNKHLSSTTRSGVHLVPTFLPGNPGTLSTPDPAVALEHVALAANALHRSLGSGFPTVLSRCIQCYITMGQGPGQALSRQGD